MIVGEPAWKRIVLQGYNQALHRTFGRTEAVWDQAQLRLKHSTLPLVHVGPIRDSEVGWR